jgi:MoaA/NifB/PqqE/SkfB family radical SAM enzyme
MHKNHDYSNCNPNACPYVANDNVEEIELEEIPKFPPALYLAYENVCNYQCIMCTIPDCMRDANPEEREKKLDKIDAEVLKILPYVKTIGAHGLGELFVSKHILKLLSQWKPLADPSECSVSLETNGSLFNEKNWSKIENLGQYNLSVHITVLSFEEPVYQEMSGTSLPVSNIINNLHFVKSLRERGIINWIEIATVYQEKNFRTLPEFAKRCIEEFGADEVRLRPYEPWTAEVTLKDWFKDVRNVYHPYHQEFLEVMKDPIFKHPKVHDWGGGKESGLGPEPYGQTRTRYHFLERIFCDEMFWKRAQEKIKTKKVVVYGLSVVGKALTSMLRNRFEIPYLIDRAMNGTEWEGISVYDMKHLPEDKDVTVVLSLIKKEDGVVKSLEEKGFGNVVWIHDLIGEEGCCIQ